MKRSLTPAQQAMMASEPHLNAPRASKSFAHGFRLVFLDDEDNEVMIEVKTLDGLRAVMQRLQKKTLHETEGNTLELQLWGILAEHSGFLRSGGGTPLFSTGPEAGIVPLGEGRAALLTDPIFGGTDDAAERINEMRALVKGEQLEHRRKTTDMAKTLFNASWNAWLAMVDETPPEITGPAAMTTYVALRKRWMESSSYKETCISVNNMEESRKVNVMDADDMVTPEGERWLQDQVRTAKKGMTSEELAAIDSAVDMNARMKVRDQEKLVTGQKAVEIGRAIESARALVDPTELEQIHQEWVTRMAAAVGGVDKAEDLLKGVHVTEDGMQIFFVDIRGMGHDEAEDFIAKARTAFEGITFKAAEDMPEFPSTPDENTQS